MVQQIVGSAFSHTVPPSQADWYERVTLRVPAVLALFVEQAQANGDPNAWAVLAGRAEQARADAARLGSRVAVVIVSPAASSELLSDRMSMLCRAAGTDKRCADWGVLRQCGRRLGSLNV